MAKRSFWKRDKNGKFARTAGGSSRRAKKIKRLQRKNKRVANSLIQDRKRRGVPESAALDPFEAAVFRGVMKREAKIAGLQRKTMQGTKVAR